MTPETLERRIITRLDDDRTSINAELDALNTRITALGAQYEALSAQVAASTADATTEALSRRVLTLCTKFDAQDTITEAQETVNVRVEDRLRNLQVQVEGLAKDITDQQTAINELHVDVAPQGPGRCARLEARIDLFARSFATLNDNERKHAATVVSLVARMDESEAYVRGYQMQHNELSERLEIVESSCRNAETFPAALTHQVHRIDAFDETITVMRRVVDEMCGEVMTLTAESKVRREDGLDTYEVDGKLATKAEADQAATDPEREHEVRVRHRPFSNGCAAPKSCDTDRVETRDIGWAVAQLKAGNKVRRKGWVATGTHAYTMPRDGIPVLIVYNPTTATARPYDVPQHELFATDWELAP